MKLVALPGTIGVEVQDLDVARMTDFEGGWRADDIESLREEWIDRRLMLIRGQMLSGEQQVAFVARFGPLVPERELWGYVSNVRPDGILREGALLFHSDFAFTPRPTRGVALYALEVPTDGAPTCFVDAVRGGCRAAARPAQAA